MAASKRLGIPISFSTDPRSGFHRSPFTGKTADAVSRWPEHTGLGATRDLDMVRQYADVIRREMLAMGIRVYLGPMADIFSEPRWSRGFGTFGEDPELVSDMVAAFIEGLRGRYGFDGIVCTDWFLLESTTVENITFGPNGHGLEHLTPTERLKAALDAGVDQFGGDDCTERVIELVASGELSEARLDVFVRRILLEKFRLGLFENRYVDVDNACDVARSRAAPAR